MFDDVQRVLAEFSDNVAGLGRPDAFDGAGGKISVDGVGPTASGVPDRTP
jgi:hypothetical protein